MRPAPTTVPKLPPVTRPMPLPSAAPPTAPFCAVLMFSHPPNRLAAASTSMIVFFRMYSPFAKILADRPLRLVGLERIVLERGAAKIADRAADQAGAHNCPEGAARRQT